MTDKRLPEDTQQQQETSLAKTFDLDQFKSLYYLLNAKPDSQIKLLTEDKKIGYDDILELNEKVQEKLRTENIKTYITTITIVFSNRQVKTFNNWSEFTRTNWQIGEQTKAISIDWDLNIKLPSHELPQRHTLKVRLGSPIRPNEMFQLMMTEDKDDEFLEMIANGVCKVDFINTVIANELLNRVDEWYSALPNNLPDKWFQKIGKRHRRKFAFVINSTIPITGIFATINVLIYFINKPDFQLNSNSGLTTILTVLGAGLALYYIADLAAKIISTNIYHKLKDFSEMTMFRLTKGDSNSILETQEKNSKASRQVIVQFIVSLIVAIIALLLGKILDKIL